MSLKRMRERRTVTIVVVIMAVLCFTAGAFADIGMTIKAILWALKADFATEKWNWEVGGSLGTNTSVNWRCWTGGSCRCEPMLAVL